MNIFGRIYRMLVRRSLPYLYRPSCTKTLVRLGSRYGGWTIPQGELTADSICYSFGVGEDATFDLELARAAGCPVYLFDPTPRATAHFAAIQKAAAGTSSLLDATNNLYSFESLQSAKLLTYCNIGIWSEDTELDFYAPADSTHVSHSVTNLQQTQIGFRAIVKSLASIAEDMGHQSLDLVKMDIEGAEMAVIDDILLNGPLPRFLAVEFDTAASGAPSQLGKLRKLIRRLKKQNYNLAHIEAWNFLFIRPD